MARKSSIRSSSAHRVASRAGVEALESRALMNGAWAGYAENAQHTALSSVASQPLQTILWQAPVDLHPQFSGNDLFIHYGSPSITDGGTMVLPVKTGTSDGFEVQGRVEKDGTLLWTIASDYVLPAAQLDAQLTRPHARLLRRRWSVAARGGRIDVINAPRLELARCRSTSSTLAFFGQANYAANPTAYNSTVFIDTPLTADANGDVFFGYTVTGSNPLGLQSGIARIAADGTGTFVATTAGRTRRRDHVQGRDELPLTWRSATTARRSTSRSVPAATAATCSRSTARRWPRQARPC